MSLWPINRDVYIRTKLNLWQRLRWGWGCCFYTQLTMTVISEIEEEDSAMNVSFPTVAGEGARHQSAAGFAVWCQPLHTKLWGTSRSTQQMCVFFFFFFFYIFLYIFLGRLIGQSSQIFVALSCLYLLVHVFTFSCLVRFWVFDLSLYQYIYLSVCPSVRLFVTCLKRLNNIIITIFVCII